MIDINILTHSGTRADWLEQCLNSLKPGFTLHILQGVEGYVGLGRARGYMVGGHDYVGYVDSDDYVLAGVGNVVRQALQHHPHGVVTRQWIENEAGGRYSVPKNGHGLAVYRRELVAPLLDELRARPPEAGVPS